MNILKKTKLAMAVTAFVGIAAVSNVNAIQVNTDGSGRILLAPVMLAMDNDSTKVTITNTDVSRAVKAHVAFRTERWSQETFDFILYLSPGDVFRGELYASDDNTVMLRTNDDSIMCLDFMGATDEPPFANEERCNGGNGMTDYVVPTIKITNPNDTINIGHIQVTSIYSVTGEVKAAKIQDSDSEMITIVRGMPKRDLRRIFDMTTEGLMAENGCTTSGADGDSCANIDAVSGDKSILRGDVALVFGDNPVHYAMTGLVDSDENGTDGVECNASYCEKVIANPFYNHTSGQEMRIGDEMGVDKDTNNLYNIERALSKAVYNGTYEKDSSNGTFLLTSLPTRYMHEAGADYCSNVGQIGNIGLQEFTSPFLPSGLVPYAQHVYNNSEGKCEIIPDIVEVERQTLRESGRTCEELEGTWESSLNLDGSLLCTSLSIVEPLKDVFLTYEVQGVNLICGNEEETQAWFDGNPSGWYQMALVESNTHGVSCGFGGVPATITTIKTSASGDVLDLIPTSH